MEKESTPRVTFEQPSFPLFEAQGRNQTTDLSVDTKKLGAGQVFGKQMATGEHSNFSFPLIGLDWWLWDLDLKGPHTLARL